MKKYYLVAEQSKDTNGNIRYMVNVRDSFRGLTVLVEFEAKSYSDAVKMFSFSAKNMGKAVYCGVDISGMPYHGGCDA